MDVADRAPALVEAIGQRTGEIVDALTALPETELLGRSTLPDWSRLTIACHLRYGAVALARMTDATLAGWPASYYPAGREQQRPTTLGPRPGETPAGVVASLAATSAALHETWSSLTADQWRREVEEPEGRRDLGPLPLANLALLRLTEVEVHGTDLDVGLPDWSDTFSSAALPFRLAWLTTRRANHRAFDAGLRGSWLLVADDGPVYRVAVDGEEVDSRPADPTTPADAVIHGSGRDLLALLLGRPTRRPLRLGGDEAFARSFSAAFPGP